MRSVIIFSILLLIVSLTACVKDEELTGNHVNFSYEETYCADSWERSDLTNDEILKARVSEYLNKSLDVDYSNIRITHDGKEEICSSCSCTTGRVIRIEADKAFKDILLDNKFKVE